MVGKRGQVTIFIVIALVLVAIVGGYFILKNRSGKEKISPLADPVEKTILSCLEEDLSEGVSVLEANGGSMYYDSFSPGSRYMPFSSHLDFVGEEIPYWYYISGNNLEVQNVPSKSDMEEDLERFVKESIKDCNLNDYYDEGYQISERVSDAKVKISGRSVEVDLKMDLVVEKEGEIATVSDHYAKVNSKIGELYDDAIKVYQKEQSDLFLEKYGIDNLRLYAPVDGVELTCSPLTWNASSVFGDIRDAVELNTLALKGSGEKNDYFNLDLPVNNEVRFVNSRNWPSKIEVSPSKGNMLIAEPVGNQQGLGILGFCYVTYHFVYDLAYPVLVQVKDPKSMEIFQFPVVVSIKKNKERSPSGEGESVGNDLPDLCEYSEIPLTVNLKDSLNRPVKGGRVYFDCSASSCFLGETKEGGSLTAKVPQCVNGDIRVEADGYSPSDTIYSSMEEGSVEIILDKQFEKTISFKLGNKMFNGKVILSFFKDDGTTLINVLPGNKKVNLSEGFYHLEARAYSNSSLNFEATTRQECVDVPTAFGGAFGITKKECFDVDVPSQLISEVLVGGGAATVYFSEEDLRKGGTLYISSEEMDKPSSIDQVQMNNILLEDKQLEVELR